MKCFTCGTDIVCNIDGHCLSWKCPNCGDGIATSYFEPIELDQVDYVLCIEPINNPTVDNLRCIASLSGCNFIEAKSKLKEKILFTQKAKNILEIALKLRSNNIEFSIVPEFPYEIK